MKVKIDLSKSGLAMLYKPYEIVGWAVVRAKGEPVGSSHVWAQTNKALMELDGTTISRASIIFFLNREVDKGFMDWDDATGKGGHHRLYFPLATEKELLRIVQGKAWDKLAHAMGEAEG